LQANAGNDIMTDATKDAQEISELADPVEVCCVVCGSNEHVIVCSANEVEVHHRYLRLFHRRRLHLDRMDQVTESALADRISFTQDYATDIVACTSCGLLFRNPRPPKASVTAMYAHDHYDENHLTTTFDTQLDLYRSKAKLLARWLPRRHPLRVVEVGSFVGSFLAAGKEMGWDMLGVDPGEQAVAFCKAKGLAVFRGTLPDLKVSTKSVDCVAIWNTFDKLPDPRPTLEAASRLLRPGGILTIRVPNGAYFVSALSASRRLPRWFARWLRAALAWNNFLMFPYLVGYSVSSADRMMARYYFRRLAGYTDTLVTLADPHVKWWAAQEERLIKLVCRGVASVESLRGSTAYGTAPWLDIYFRKGGSPGR